MIYDSIKNKKNYEKESEIYQALCFLEEMRDWKKMNPGTEVQGSDIFANPVSFLSKPEEECVYEAHKKYIDLHYIVEGEEKIATADVEKLQVQVPYDEIKDIGFYEGHECGSYLLKPGDFMVCFPSDAHKVGMMGESQNTVKKVVVKIKVKN